MSKIPCKNCITLMICKNRGTIFNLVKKCKLLNTYLEWQSNNEEWNERYGQAAKVAFIYLKERKKQ